MSFPRLVQRIARPTVLDDSDIGTHRDELRILRLEDGVATLPIDAPLTVIFDQETGAMTIETAVMTKDTKAFIARLALSAVAASALMRAMVILEQHEAPGSEPAPFQAATH